MFLFNNKIVTCKTADKQVWFAVFSHLKKNCPRTVRATPATRWSWMRPASGEPSFGTRYWKSVPAASTTHQAITNHWDIVYTETLFKVSTGRSTSFFGVQISLATLSKPEARSPRRRPLFSPGLGGQPHSFSLSSVPCGRVRHRRVLRAGQCWRMCSGVWGPVLCGKSWGDVGGSASCSGKFTVWQRLGGLLGCLCSWWMGSTPLLTSSLLFHWQLYWVWMMVLASL